MSTSVVKAMLVAFTGYTIWVTGDAAIRFLKDYSPFQLAFTSIFFGLLMQLAFSSRMGGLRRTFSMPKQKWQWFRAVILGVSSFCSFLIFSNLELTTGYAVLFTSPFWAKIFSGLIMKEQIPPRIWLITLCGFIGVLVALRPGSIPMNVGTVAALVGVIFFALSFILTRYIGEENQTLLSYNVYVDILTTLALAAPAWHFFQPMPLGHLALNAGIGVIGFTGTILVSQAFARAPAAFVAPVHYSQIIWGVIFGALLFGEYPDFYTVVGILIISLAGLALIFTSRRVSEGGHKP